MSESTSITPAVRITVEINFARETVEPRGSVAPAGTGAASLLPSARSPEVTLMVDLSAARDDRQGGNTADAMPEIGSPEFAVAYRQMWVAVGKKIAPNHFSWGHADDSP